MAIYHCSIKNISRGNGKSAVAAAAYRSGEELHSDEFGQTFDYTRKQGIETSGVILCKNAPKVYYDREVLWNAVEKIEKAADSRFAREWEVAIPKELSKNEGQRLIYNFARSLADEGMCIDYAIHDKGDGNRHAHIMGTTRTIKENGEWAAKSRKVYDLDANGERIPVIDKNTGEQKVDKQNRKQWKNHKEDYTDWNKTEKVEEWRKRWEVMCNRFLSQEQQIDHRSYERQGIEQMPTIHEGYNARKIEKSGEMSDRCEYNRDIKTYNNAIQEMKEMLKSYAGEVIKRIRGSQRSLEHGREAYRGERTIKDISGAVGQRERETEQRERETEQREPEITRNYERYATKHERTGNDITGIRSRIETLRRIIFKIVENVEWLKKSKSWDNKSREKIAEILQVMPSLSVTTASEPEKQPERKPETLKDLIARKQAEADKINAERGHQTIQKPHRSR